MADADKEKAPIIGDFSGPQGNTPRTRVPLQRKEEPVNPLTPDSESKPPAQVPEGKKNVETIIREGTKPLTVEEMAQRYLDGLEQHNVTLNEARAIQDTLLVDLVYTEEARLNSKVSILMRTRIYRDVERTLRLIESEAPQLPMHVNDLLARYNVAASLARYGNTVFEFPPVSTNSTEEEKAAVEDAFYARLDFIMNLPTTVVGKLIDAVAEFDEKLTVVLAKGAPEDF